MAAYALVAAGAEGHVAGAGEDDHADLGVFVGLGEGVGEFKDRLGAEGVAHLGPVDGDLRDALCLVEMDVGVAAGGDPVDAHAF